MASTVELVEGHLESDLVIERAVSRGVLSYRRAARWMIEHNGWDTTEEAVVSALRRYQPPNPRTSIDEGYELLRWAQTGLTTGWALVEISAVPSVQTRILGTIEPHIGSRRVAVLPGTDRTVLLLEDRLAEILQEKRPDEYEKIGKPVSQVRVGLSSHGPAAGMALSILFNTFGYRGIELLGVYNSGPEYSFLVPDAFTEPAHDVLLHLRGDSPASQ